MTAETTERETLWVTDAELIRRIGCPEKIARDAIRMLDRDPRSGFPRKQQLWGGRRYWPAVKQWCELYDFRTGKSLARKQIKGKRDEKEELIGKVYFLASPTHVKIGFSAAGVKRRARSIRQNHYEELELLGVLNDVPQQVERKLHQRFASLRAKGEWFQRGPEIEAFVRDIGLGHWRKELLP